MDSAPERKNKSAICMATRAKSVRVCSRTVRRQLLHLSSVYQRSSGYYREALRPVIRKIISQLEART